IIIELPITIRQSNLTRSLKISRPQLFPRACTSSPPSESPPSFIGANPRFSASAPISSAAPSSSLARNTTLLPPCTAGSWSRTAATKYWRSPATPSCVFSASLIHPPGRIHGSCESVPSLLELRHIANYPTMNRGVRYGDSALSHHRDQISIAQPVGDVPADAQLDDLGIEAAAAVHGVSDNWPSHLGIPWMP